MDSLTGGRMEDSMAGIEIDFNVACSAIILACPNEDLFSMRNRLGTSVKNIILEIMLRGNLGRGYI